MHVINLPLSTTTWSFSARNKRKWLSPETSKPKKTSVTAVRSTKVSINFQSTIYLVLDFDVLYAITIILYSEVQTKWNFVEVHDLENTCCHIKLLAWFKCSFGIFPIHTTPSPSLFPVNIYYFFCFSFHFWSFSFCTFLKIKKKKLLDRHSMRPPTLHLSFLFPISLIFLLSVFCSLFLFFPFPVLFPLPLFTFFYFILNTLAQWFFSIDLTCSNFIVLGFKK